MTSTARDGRRRDVVVVFGAALALAALAWLLGFMAAFTVAAPSPPVPEGIDGPSNWGLFGEAWAHIEREFYGSEPTGLAITQGAIQGLVESLDDPYATFVSSDAARGSAAGFGPELVDGVGAWVEPMSIGALVVSTLPDSPAERSGLVPGDTILAADGTALAGKDRRETMALLGGAPGTTVEMVVRDASSAARAVGIERTRVVLPDVEDRRLAPGTAYLRIARFGPEVVPQLDDALERLSSETIGALVLDLRDNPGGDTESLRSIAGRFMTGPLWIEIDTAGSEVGRATAGSDSPHPAVPDRLVVLVNGGTVGEAEILAGALRTARGAELIGQPTFGKGTLQGLRELADHSFLRLTVATWRTPDNNDVDGVGLEPDRLVEGSDAQLESAVQRVAVGQGG